MLIDWKYFRIAAEESCNLVPNRLQKYFWGEKQNNFDVLSSLEGTLYLVWLWPWQSHRTYVKVKGALLITIVRQQAHPGAVWGRLGHTVAPSFPPWIVWVFFQIITFSVTFKSNLFHHKLTFNEAPLKDARHLAGLALKYMWGGWVYGSFIPQPTSQKESWHKMKTSFLFLQCTKRSPCCIWAFIKGS